MLGGKLGGGADPPVVPLDEAVTPSWLTSAAADIGRGLRQVTTASAVPARPGGRYPARTAVTSRSVSGAQSGSARSLPMP